MNDEKNTREDLIRTICDKRTTDAMGILKAVNKRKHTTIEDKILAYHQKTGSMVDFETYLRIVKDTDSKDVTISFQRRENSFGLDDICDD